jgi:hypothetical protein
MKIHEILKVLQKMGFEINDPEDIRKLSIACSEIIEREMDQRKERLRIGSKIFSSMIEKPKSEDEIYDAELIKKDLKLMRKSLEMADIMIRINDTFNHEN